MEFVETLIFWCPHVDRAMCNNFSTRTVELRPSEGREILPFPFFFSFPFFFPTNPFLFAYFFLFFPFFAFLLSFSFLSTNSFLFAFLFSLLIFSFLLEFSPIFRASLTGWSREEASSPFLHATCVVLNFPSFFLIPLFSFIASSIMWLIVSHTFKCTTWLLPCVTLLGYHGASP